METPPGVPSGVGIKPPWPASKCWKAKARNCSESLWIWPRKANIHALRLCLERIVPPRKERCIHLELQPIVSPQDLPIRFQDITAVIAEGRITPGEGESISNILSSHAQTWQLVKMDQRVAELEGHFSEMASYRKEMEMFKEQNREGLQKFLDKAK